LFVKINILASLSLVWTVPGCRSSPTTTESVHGSDSRSPGREAHRSGPALPLERIAIVGASVSAGFGGMPFGDAFTAAAPRSKIDTAASTLLFREPLRDIKRQLAQASAFAPSTVVALDLLFWCAYGRRDHLDRMHTLEVALAELETLRAAGAWIVLGDIPLITTASELMLPKDAIPDATGLASVNDAVRTWATRERVLMIPLVDWTDPLRADADVEIAPGEKVPARSLMALDGLHANPLGTWYLLNRLDHFIEGKLPGTAKDALVFVRPRE
jgi:hypothetical protein